MSESQVKLDEVGYWSEIKLEILKRYAEAYSTILSAQEKRGRKFDHYYIDAFAGAGKHISKRTGELIPGSPTNAILVEPPFKGYYFIDLDQLRVEELRRLAMERRNVVVYEGDCNKYLINDILPQIKYEQYRRALCILDPYGLHLNWEVMAMAGRMKTIDIFLNFPIADMNRNVLWHNHESVDERQKARMDAFWGDRSWKEGAYDTDQDMFSYPQKTDNDSVVRAFQERLKKIAGFKYVPEPLPMRNKTNAIVYYLFFASHYEPGNKIAKHIFSMFRDRMGT